MKWFCKHEYEINDIEVSVYDFMNGILIKRGEKRFWNCCLCGKHKEKWLYVEYKRS